MNYVELLKKGAEEWAKEKENNEAFLPDLRDVNFVAEFGGEDFYDLPNFTGVDFSNADMNMSSLRNYTFCDCCFDGAQITYADLVDAYFCSCTFKNTNMRVSKIGSARFYNCVFEDADMSYCSAEETSFEGSVFKNTRMEHMSLVKNDFSNAQLDGCRLYGISSWDLILHGSLQKNLIITTDDMPEITVDNIELAQFLYLMINNQKLRDVISAITSKVVLILGNFSPERKEILDGVRDYLRENDVIPVMFDFEKPSTRNLTETVMTLASMSKFVVADISSPRSIPHELASVARDLPSVNFYPIIISGERPFAMFDDYRMYSWIHPIKEYTKDNIKLILSQIINNESNSALDEKTKIINNDSPKI